MVFFLIQRLFQATVLMLVVALIAFTMFQFTGDPVDNMVTENATQAERDALRDKLGLNDSVPVQYLRFVGNAVRGEFGVSYYNQSDVFNLIMERLPATLELVLVAVILSLLIGIPIGVWISFSTNRALTGTVQILSLVGVSLPSFLVGILLIVVFAVWLGWLPSSGRGEVVQLGFWSTGLLSLSGWKSVLLPAMSLSFFLITMIMRLIKSEMQETLQTEYIKFARARGIPERSLRYRHALRNSILPVITVVGLQIGNLIAFAVITETIFQWPGMGLLFIQAVNFVDIPVISAYLVFVALIFIAVNTSVDVIYRMVDPRMRTSAGD